jgi:hypothetical protein
LQVPLGDRKVELQKPTPWRGFFIGLKIIDQIIWNYFPQNAALQQ